MIVLDHPNAPICSSVLHQPGGFAWWYAEVLDDKGNGMVLIWSFGLPFLPGYKSANDSGKPETPFSRPSLNVALYEAGEPSFYMLHEFAPKDVSWDGGNEWRFGETTMRCEDKDGRRFLSVSIDCPVAGGQDRLRGTVQLDGWIPTGMPELPADADLLTHRWTPLALPAVGRFDLSTTDYQLSVDGHGYFDRNASAHALHRLDIQYWLWGHARCGQGNRIFYVLWEKDATDPLTLGYELDGKGRWTTREDLTPVFSKSRRTAYGMKTWDYLSLVDRVGASWMSCQLSRCVDNGPFYLRYITDASFRGEMSVLGTAELIAPDRVDLRRHRPLVRMRVSRDSGSNSMWLPLFEGVKDTRVSRLLKTPMRKVLGR